MVITKGQKTRGYLSAFGVLFTQGFESVLIPFLYISLLGFIGLTTLQTASTNVFVATISSIKEILCFICVLLIWGPRFILQTLRKLKNKRQWWFILAEGFGTNFGNIFFTLGIVFAGSSYGIVLTALYPIWTMLLNKLFYKSKDQWQTLLWMLAALLSGVCFVIVPIITEGSALTNRIRIGIIFGLLAGIFWAIQAFVMKFGMRQNPQTTNKEIIVLRVVAMTIFTTIIYLPIAMLFGNQEPANSYTIFAKIVSNWRYLLILVALAINIWLMRIFHTFAINHVGIKITAIIDTNNFLVPALFAQMLRYAPDQVGTIFASQALNPWLFFIIIPLAISLMMAIYYSNKDEIKTFDIHA